MEQALSETKTAKQRALFTSLKYIFIFLVFLPLSFAEIYGMRPFAAAFFIALAYLGLPLVFIAPFYVASEVLASLSIFSFIASVICVAVTGLALFIKSKKQNYGKIILPVFTLLSQAGLIFSLLDNKLNVLLIALSVLITVGFTYLTINGLRPLIAHKLKYKLLETEMLFLGVLTVITSLGLSSLNFSFPVIALAGSFSVYIANRLKGVAGGIVLAFCFGLGMALNDYNISSIGIFVFIAVISGIFSSAPRILTALSGTVAYIMFVFFFNIAPDNTVLWIVAISISGIIYALISQKFLSKIKEYVFESHERTAVRYMINKNRSDVGAEILSTSVIFESMAEIMNDKPDFVPAFKGALKNRCCEFCENKENCGGAAFDKALDKMTEITFSKGRMAVSDIPEPLASKCTHLGKLISSVSEIEEKRKITRLKNECDRSSRKIIAQQLSGISDVLKKLAVSQSRPLIFDRQKEKIIVEELNYLGVVCAQCLIAGDDMTLIIRSECLDRKLIEKTITRLCKINYKIDSIDDTMLAGFCSLKVIPMPRYDMVFGVASKAKTEGAKSGDTHSFIKIGHSKLLIALCDGMGSGEKAQKISESAISLVENFYRAGFDNELVLKSVNKFLSVKEDESFSAIDICVVDLNTAKADIIKMGCPPSYIKKKDVIMKVESEALPLGAVENLSPSVTSVDLNSGDMLLLVSDGVSDNFEGDKLSATVNNLRTLNPQTMAKGILQQTFDIKSREINDDSTVIAARLIERI